MMAEYVVTLSVTLTLDQGEVEESGMSLEDYAREYVMDTGTELEVSHVYWYRR